MKRNAVLLRAVPTAQVGRHRQDRAGAGADAVDRGDDRLRAGAHRLDQVAGHARERQQLAASSAWTSGPMISCTSPPEQKLSPAPVRTTDLARRSRGAGAEQVAQLGVRVEGERVLALGAVERDRGDAAVQRPLEVLRAVAGERAPVAGGERRVERAGRWRRSSLSSCVSLGWASRAALLPRWDSASRADGRAACRAARGAAAMACASKPAKSSRIQRSCSLGHRRERARCPSA